MEYQIKSESLNHDIQIECKGYSFKGFPLGDCTENKVAVIDKIYHGKHLQNWLTENFLNNKFSPSVFYFVKYWVIIFLTGAQPTGIVSIEKKYQQ